MLDAYSELSEESIAFERDVLQRCGWLMSSRELADAVKAIRAAIDAHADPREVSVLSDFLLELLSQVGQANIATLGRPCLRALLTEALDRNCKRSPLLATRLALALYEKDMMLFQDAKTIVMSMAELKPDPEQKQAVERLQRILLSRGNLEYT
jgi:hypothetical protein